jgi:predicted nucleotidyltransferase component of viral defense system
MSKKKQATKALPLTLDQIKRITLTAMVADDDLYNTLVLKGGNAMALVHAVGSRQSVDLDFSMKDDIVGSIQDFYAKIEKSLNAKFRAENHIVFDVKIEEKPKSVTPDMAGFWGGYGIEFKLVTAEVFAEHNGDINELRRRALQLGQKARFLIDLSRYEYTDGKQRAEVDGYMIFVYTPQMIVCEKLRAICQQMPGYDAIVQRGRPGTPRARDFYDIYILVSTFKIDLGSKDNIATLVGMFEAKHVPIEFLKNIEEFREFHRTDFAAVLAAVNAGTQMEEFDFYFEFTTRLALEAFGNV